MVPKRYYKLIVLFLSPAVLLYAIFVIYPTLSAFYISLFRWRGVSRQMTFVGLQNFVKLFQDPIIWKALLHNGFFIIAFPIAILIPATLFALALRKNIVGSHFYRVAFLFPNLMSAVVIAILWALFYDPNLGLVNASLRLVGLNALAKPWLGEPHLALPALVVPIAWANIGFYTMILYGGLVNIPQEFYEAAALEGASGWKQFWSITVPLLWDITTIVTIFIVIGALNEFSLVFITTNGGPSRATEVIATYMYKQFLQSDYGYGAAVGVVQFTLSVVVLVTFYVLMRRERIEY